MAWAHMGYSKNGFGIPKITSGWLGIPLGIPNLIGSCWTLSDRDDAGSAVLTRFYAQKRRPWTSLDVVLVEPGGFEPPSASSPLSVLHA